MHRDVDDAANRISFVAKERAFRFRRLRQPRTRIALHSDAIRGVEGVKEQGEGAGRRIGI